MSNLKTNERSAKIRAQHRPQDRAFEQDLGHGSASQAGLGAGPDSGAGADAGLAASAVASSDSGHSPQHSPSVLPSPLQQVEAWACAAESHPLLHEGRGNEAGDAEVVAK
jgi:hypothetical protein